ncbi:hypothetical protein MACJ_002414 [Theileria orientalis]|uniref:Uncharacterized protein n=1 Tax=Theileria orientalis TaxID=68886 RepID=A0A976QRC3_THEOR|nr:hypothetical protein MACJ_002414 [Theileria orientalis]
MGGSYSDLNVYFCSKKGGYDGIGYKVKTTLENYKECSNFIVLIHKIDFTPPADGRNYNVILYDGDNSNNGNYVFGYYYPSDHNQVIEEVRTYYSVLAPNVPLVVSFKTKTNIYNCYFGDLKNAGWDRAYNISRYSFGDRLEKERLLQEFTKLLLNRKIRFVIGKGNKDIMLYKQEINYEANFRLICIPKGNESILGSECLFSLNFNKNEPICPDDPNPEKPNYCLRAMVNELCGSMDDKESCGKFLKQRLSHKHDKFQIRHNNTIDEYFLRPFNKELYDGIIVYLVREENQKPPDTLCDEEKDERSLALLLEFIDSSKEKTYLKRKDKDGCWWYQEKVDYNDDATLLSALREIKLKVESQKVVVILDKTEKYKGVSILKGEVQNPYKKYTHEFKKGYEPVLLFERQQQEIIKGTKPKAKIVEVYYLKTKSRDDKQPFLIVFDQGSDYKDKKAYHFNNTDKFEEWKEFEYHDETTKKKITEKDLVDKLYERVGRIERNLKCVENLNILRSMAYEILTGKDPPTFKEEDETEVTRPPEQQPPPTTEPLSIPLIAGCTVGGVVFVVSSAVGYGVYWYNTTIKLLT